MSWFARLLLLVFATVTLAAPVDKNLSKAGRAEVVLFIGSSTIVNWQSRLSSDFPEFQTVAEGRSGSEYSWLLETAAISVRKHNPDHIVIYSGDNDLANGLSPETVARNFAQTVQFIRAVKPEAPIYVLSIKPAPGRRKLIPEVITANAFVRETAAHLHKVIYVDIFSSMMGEDGEIFESNFDPDDSMHIHLSPSGYALWTSLLGPRLKR